ncbi:MAG TPA: hypothetical protein VM386_03945, partial [Acidimicrobiales bacterium]|nr:hypothetical protein [Acidimicrobiales bacterium]
DDPATSLAGRAYRQEAEALASAACLDVDPALGARLGPRPAGGPERRTWDQAVGRVATYRARWGAMPEPGGTGASWALGPAPGGGPALAQYRAAAEALEAAERSTLAASPTAELADQRRALQRALVATPVPAQLDHAQAALTGAERGLAQAQVERAQAAQRLEQMSRRRGRRRNPQGIEMARQSLQRADQRYARAEVELERADAALAALEQQQPGQDLVRQRLDTVEGALARQVERAVATPAPYLTAALGEPSHDDASPPVNWREAATRIESYRHRELGRAPGEGPVVDEDGLLGAIGPRPGDYLQALKWDHAAEAVAPEAAPDLEPRGPELGL